MWTASDILALRQKLRESQAQFAQRFGVNQSTIHRWETEGLPDNALWRPTIEDRLGSIKRGAAA